ncbi:dipeptidase PepV [Liquorilactobacillus mali]|uniref:Xaa-His dipeptidase n=1 Tax=Liquorilactobacillus mali KCTC 3596 = DSM 20444 TaxID=1046596 RepID=J0UQK4_9LACO|nr:dipeptidase PepV [Liquorilactobacillus mali]EJE98242.1 Xaa-His dipeptidase [Liquorilactobacillus mali KCTC 3596 = DSM 20444]KRN10476.1 Xaa-His dipeptidase [Liquorilactobacillus mali KCTC 3596 = DSM 20444]MDC7951842.1 dipeptidase PepV [Liquorilactobacillus mali]MDV7757057.1 dipeptidase PepV [Liquorilactobacillus mali]QFQ75103.1 dipeptidase PepV [Liquorilactobacillus mali]
MQIDWQKEIDQRKDALLADLTTMLKIESVRDEKLGSKNAPFGPGPREALDKFLEIGKRDGFEVLDVDGIAGHLEYGTGAETMGILAHVDVMPAGKGWNTNPFEPVIKDGKLFARGSSDDKGPGMAAYYGLKIIKELGLPISKKVRLIIGTDEESGWRCMTHYFGKMPLPDFGFSPDAFFPLINGEKGNVSFNVDFQGGNGTGAKLLDFSAGLRENMVPRDAVAHISGIEFKKVKELLDRFANNKPIEAKTVEQDERIEISVVGKAAHAQEPKNGENAGTYLALFLKQVELGAGAKQFIDFAADYLHEDSRMDNFDLHFSDEIMGDLTMNAGIFSFAAAQGGRVTLNFRFPKGIGASQIEEALTRVAKGVNAQVNTTGKMQEPHYVSPEDPLVKTLLDVYERQTGNEGYGMVVGGGTYGRLLKRGVAFGAMFPGTPDTMHQANEYMLVEDILKAAAIYAEAIYELIK